MGLAETDMRIRGWRLLLGGACLALSCSLARPAGADPAADQYVVTVNGNSVEICLSYGDTCQSSMLRQDVDGGASVALAGFLNDGGCYVDDCVLSGTYRYGCETPLGQRLEASARGSCLFVRSALNVG